MPARLPLALWTPGRFRAARTLARRLLEWPWTPTALKACIDAELGYMHPQTRKALLARLTALAAIDAPPSPPALVSHLVASSFFRPLIPAPPPHQFTPTTPFAHCPIPALSTQADLCAWLGTTPERLVSLSGERGRHARTASPTQQHYRYALIPKRTGPARLLEAPKPRLKAIQRRILREILDHIPVHDCARGFVPGRSCLDHAQVHAGETVVMTLDLAGFFPSIGRPRIQGLFRSLGYPRTVARSLAGLCTTTTPKAVLPEPSHDPLTHAPYRFPHLPQGAPTSPAIANLLAWTLDRRLHGLARAACANYTRYADDLAFSGDAGFAARIDRFRRCAEAVIREEGFTPKLEKTRIMRRHASQRVTGLVVNQHCNVSRAEFDALKATLHNCVRAGPATQNRADAPDFRRHLDGRIVWVEQVNPARGTKLRRVFEQIDWNASGTHHSQLQPLPHPAPLRYTPAMPRRVIPAP